MRVALHTRLKPGREEEYEAAHREVPRDLVAAIRAAGAREWTIWRDGLDLFHVIDCDNYERLLAALADLPVNVAWQASQRPTIRDVRNHRPQADLPEVAGPLLPAGDCIHAVSGV